MIDDGILKDNSVSRVTQSLIEEVTDEEKKEFESLKFIDVNVEQAEYIQTLGQGWAYPLDKFQDEMQLLEVLHMKTLTDKSGKRHLFSVPITQSVTKEERESLKDEKRIAIKCTAISPDVLAIIENPVFFDNRKEEIATRVYGTRSLKHPKVERLEEQGEFLVSGSNMRYVANIKFNDDLDQYRLTPKEVNEKIKAKNADAVYAFQLRNPLHNGHILLLNDTREQLLKQGFKNPILLLHPLGGWVKDDDVPLDTRMKQH